MADETRRNSVIRAAALALCFLAPFSADGQDRPGSPYPRIESLDNGDMLFNQLTDDITAAHRAFAQGLDLPPLLFFRYRVKNDEDLFTIAARTNLRVDTIASLNRITRPGDLVQGVELALPNIPGVFAAKEPESDVESIGLALRQQRIEEGIDVILHLSAPRRFTFFPDESYHPVERAYFLGILFRFPLDQGSVTSAFGARLHPISGERSLHTGIDIAAPFGTPVIAARAGKVESKGYDENGLGNYISLLHEGGYTTLYGHLSSITVNLNQQVNSGSLLGTVGSTGLSTGPHLHFEVRNEGELRDPIPLIHGKSE